VAVKGFIIPKGSWYFARSYQDFAAIGELVFEFDKLFDRGRKIRITKVEPCASTGKNPLFASMSLAAMLNTEQVDMGIPGSKCLHNLSSAIRTSVIHDDNLRAGRIFEVVKNFGQAIANPLFFIIRRNDN
jgi:hypothetical protein